MQAIQIVFPAHAGMSPRHPTSRPAGYGFPRSRGDEPNQCAPITQAGQFSPLTRG